MKHRTFLFLIVFVSLCHASSAMAHLHPNLQRFAQRDPHLYVDSANLYQYVNSKPITLTDSSGKDIALFFPDISCIINMMNLANTVPPPGGWRPQNPSFDDWKHCFAGCMMRKFCGPVSANAAAWGDEIYEAIRQKPWQQRDIDNTNTGIYCATGGCRWFERNGVKGCTDCCLEQNQTGQTK